MKIPAHHFGLTAVAVSGSIQCPSCNTIIHVNNLLGLEAELIIQSEGVLQTLDLPEPVECPTCNYNRNENDDLIVIVQVRLFTKKLPLYRFPSLNPGRMV